MAPRKKPLPGRKRGRPPVPPELQKKKPPPTPVRQGDKTHGFTVSKKTGELLEPMIDAVEHHLLWGTPRNQLVAELAPKYDVADMTIDRAIREVKDRWIKASELGRQERVAKKLRQLERITEKAFQVGELRDARGAIMDGAKFTGDLAPELHLFLGGDRSPQELLDEAKELARLAELSLQGKKKPEEW